MPVTYTNASFPPGLPAQNTLLRVTNNACPAVFNVVANVGDLALSTKVAEADVTSHSTGNPWDEWLPTLLSGGQLKLPLFFIPESAGADGASGRPEGHDATNGLYSIFINRQTRQYSIEFPNGQGVWCYMNMYIVDFGWKAPVKGVLTADVTFRITGEPDFLY